MPDLEERVAALEATVAMLTLKLLQRGDITINDARAAQGLPAWHEASAVTGACGFDDAWTGPCREPAPCGKHTELHCSQCGNPATRECPCMHQLTCHRPLCGDCKCECCPAVVP